MTHPFCSDKGSNSSEFNPAPHRKHQPFTQHRPASVGGRRSNLPDQKFVYGRIAKAFSSQQVRERESRLRQYEKENEEKGIQSGKASSDQHSDGNKNMSRYGGGGFGGS